MTLDVLWSQCQVGVLPLGTGNDLSRVLGWGAKFDDESQLQLVMEQLEHAQIKMLDRSDTHSLTHSVICLVADDSVILICL